jgi:hypothetical protein
MTFKFEKLEVWQKAIKFGFHIHELTRKFPKEELYILTSQIKRAADSVGLTYILTWEVTNGLGN